MTATHAINRHLRRLHAVASRHRAGQAPAARRTGRGAATITAPLAAALAALLITALAGGGCGPGEGGEANAGPPGGAATASDEVGKVINVEVLELQPRSFTATVRITGTVSAVHDAVVSAEEGGVLERFLVAKGARVRSGEPIAQIDDRLLRTQVAAAAATAALARETYERRERLWHDEKVGSELTYLAARHEAEAASATLEGLRTRLAKTTIVAPFDGVFDHEYVDIGEMAAPGTPVARVIGTELEVTGGVPERYARDVNTRTHATVTFDVLPGVQLDCPVRFVGSAIDEGSRTFTVELRLDDPPPFIKPAMIANIELVQAALEDVLVVPQSAVSRVEHGFQVFVAHDAEASLRAAARAVELGVSQANQVVVTAGLEAGERVIVNGKVDDQDRIRVAAGGAAAARGATLAGGAPAAGSGPAAPGEQP